MDNFGPQQTASPQPWTGLMVPERYGVFCWWPYEGTDWIHDDDVAICECLIPSDRVFLRQRLNNVFSIYRYGGLKIRLRAAMWLEVEIDGYLIGDRVEIKSQLGKRRPAIATITEMRYNRRCSRIEYQLRFRDSESRQRWVAADFQPAFKLDQPLSGRQKMLMDKSKIGSFR